MRPTRAAEAHQPALAAWLTFCTWFFSIRPVLTLLLHTQLVLPTSWYPSLLIKAHRWWIQWSGDQLMSVPPRWWQGTVMAMVLVQMPYEVWACHQIYTGSRTWIYWLPAYCIHTATCMIPVLADILIGQYEGMNRFRTLLPKTADFLGVLLLAAFAQSQGAHWASRRQTTPASPAKSSK